MNPELTDDINYRASVRLATAAKQAGVKRFIYASSCSLYGSSSADEILTEDAPFNPLTPYALSKIRTEQSVSELADAHFSPIFMRNATAYGLSPRLRADIVLNNLVCWAHTTGRIRIMSDGTPWRPIVHIEDISRAFAAALSAPREAIHNQAFNVGVNDENYQVREIAEIVRQTVPGCSVEYAAQSGPDPRNYRVEFTKISRSLPDFQPQWNARRGARELHDAFVRIGFSEEDFQSRKFTRLKQLSHLLEAGLLDEGLRWKDVSS
jgi:nucleoside-diphosphate-sugar epimerase